MEKFRLLNAEEIECKVKKVTEKGAIILLYKTARTDMDLLDESFGAENWTCKYEEIKGNLYCSIGIKFGDEWIWKQDCGIESREDDDGNQKKGEASDAFKRAGFKWGIGRELYTSPFIWVASDKLKIENYNGKFRTNDSFSVESIGYDDKRRIVSLSIRNDKKKVTAFSFGGNGQGRKKTGGSSEGKRDTKGEELPKLVCEECRKVILSYTARNGKEISADAHIALTQKLYGKSLCVECARKADAAAKTAMMEKDDKK